MQYIIRKLENHRKNSESSEYFHRQKRAPVGILTQKEYMELPELERRICADMRKKDSGSANLCSGTER